MDLKPSAWDRSWGAIASATEDAALRARIAQRVAPFEHAAEQLGSGGDIEPAILSKLASDYKRRNMEPPTPPPSRAETFAGQLLGASAGPGSGGEIGAAVMAFVVFAGLFALVGPLAIAVVIVFIIWVVVRVSRRIRLPSRAACALAERKCPDCEYDLAVAPAGIPAHLLGGINIGPRRCPECGVSWPLIPPEKG